MHVAGTDLPSAWIERFLPWAPAGGDALDLACGAGRHTRLLLTRGFRVVAVDRDLSRLQSSPAARGTLEPLSADLESVLPEDKAFPLAGRMFDTVIVTNYLHRPLLAWLRDAVRSPGLLLYETFGQGNQRFGKPSNPDFLLAPGELLELVRGHLEVLAYEHLETSTPRPAIVQRIAARRLPSAGTGDRARP